MSDMHTRVPKKFFHLAFSATLFILLLSTTITVHAATLTIDPEEGEYGPGDIFVAAVRINPAIDECVNVVHVAITYPKELIRVSAFSKGESLLSLWTEEPVIDNERGIVRWSGGIPAGYCGRVSGDPGQTNILGKIIFTLPGNMIGGAVLDESTSIPVTFGDETRALLNDGLGTPAQLSFVHASYTRRTKSASTPLNSWQYEIERDEFPPDLFGVELVKDPNTFQGKYFIVFGTLDKQTGVHHYEVMEEDIEHFGFVRGKKERAVFHEVTSPYVLLDQTLRSRITVRAYDHAGNMQEVIFVPKETRDAAVLPKPTSGENNILRIAITAALLFIITVLFGAFFVLRKRKKNEHDVHGGIQ